jgi:predicted Zn-dependent protease
MGAGVGGAAAGAYLGDAVQLAQMGTVLSLLAYSRELEAEADAMGLKLIAEAGYDPLAMPGIWQQLIEEVEASARMRRKRPVAACPSSKPIPAPESRMVDLRASAQK